jgi:H+/Cl- antiporter ClcA
MPFMAHAPLQPNVIGSGSLRAFSARFWVLVVVTGVGAGLAGGCLMILLHLVQRLAYPYRPGDNFLSAVENATSARILLALVAAGLLAAAARYLLQQTANGGHGGELAARIWFHAGRLEIVPTLPRAILSIVIVGMGASLGREAAPKQVGALIASLLGQWARIPDTERRLLAACGAGAGIAAVYNVPFGGAAFALEVFLGTISLPLAPPALAASLIGAATSWLLLPNAPTYEIPFYPARLDEIVFALLAGPLAGLASVAYVRLISWADALKPRRPVGLIAPVAVFAALGVLALRYPQLLGNGKDVVQQSFLGELGPPLLLALVFLKPLATAACLGCGAPGGLFMPTITLGALLGGMLGTLWLHVWPGAPLGSFAIMGASAVLAASTQGPVSSIILMLELTRRLDSLMAPALLATAGAVLVARLLEPRSIYSGRIHAGRSAAERVAGENGTDGSIRLSGAARYVEVLQALARGFGGPRPIYVVDEDGRLVGEVLAASVQEPLCDGVPLEIATASDFATKVEAILASDDERTIERKFAATDRAALPVISPTTHELVGVRRRASRQR